MVKGKSELEVGILGETTKTEGSKEEEIWFATWERGMP
jgi:hypothetical protein